MAWKMCFCFLDAILFKVSIWIGYLDVMYALCVGRLEWTLELDFYGSKHY